MVSRQPELAARRPGGPLLEAQDGLTRLPAREGGEVRQVPSSVAAVSRTLADMVRAAPASARADDSSHCVTNPRPSHPSLRELALKRLFPLETKRPDTRTSLLQHVGGGLRGKMPGCVCCNTLSAAENLGVLARLDLTRNVLGTLGLHPVFCSGFTSCNV